MHIERALSIQISGIQEEAHTKILLKMAPKNKVIELQKLFQTSTKPLWWRHPRSPFYLYPYYALMAVAVIGPLLYIPNAIRGIKDERKKNLA